MQLTKCREFFSYFTCHFEWYHLFTSVGSKSSLTHWGRDEMNNISQTTFSNAFSSMKIFEFRSKFHWSLFPRVQSTIFHDWFGAVQATSHYLNQWRLVYRRIYASLGLNESTKETSRKTCEKIVFSTVSSNDWALLGARTFADTGMSKYDGSRICMEPEYITLIYVTVITYPFANSYAGLAILC